MVTDNVQDNGQNKIDNHFLLQKAKEVCLNCELDKETNKDLGHV